MILTESQVQALEKKKHDDEACGEVETAPSRLPGQPGYLLRWDPEGRRHGFTSRPSSIPTRAVAQAKLYTTKTPITAADMLNDKVLPYFEEHELTGAAYPHRSGARNIAANRSNTTSSCSSPSTTSSTPEPRPSHAADQRHLRAVPQNDPAGILSRYAFRKTVYDTRGRLCRPIWTSGSSTTTMSEPIRAKGVADARPLRQ